MKNIKKPALFYEYEFYPLSNFSSFEVLWQGEIWKTAEYAYQASRFEDKIIREKIKNARSSHDAMKLAKIVYRIHQRKDWQEIKLHVMEDILRAKLSQHFYVQKKLLQTGDREIVEDSHRDGFWGRGPDWKGENHLGRIWMKLRDELRAGAIPFLEENYQ